MGKTTSMVKKYKSQSGATKQSAPGKIKSLNDKTLKSFFPAQHNLKHGENIFKCFEDESTNGIINEANQKAPKENKAYKPAPLILTDKSFKIDQFLSHNEVTKYHLKLLYIQSTSRRQETSLSAETVICMVMAPGIASGNKFVLYVLA